MKHTSVIILFTITLVITSCTKDFLDAKPSSEILRPVTLDEFEKLLDNYDVINRSGGLGILAGEEYEYSSDDLWMSTVTITARNSFIWAKDLYGGEKTEYWNAPYTAIFYANNVLEGLNLIPITLANNVTWNTIKARALFIRAFAYYDLVTNFSAIYDTNKSVDLLGIPLKLSASVDQVLPRSSVKQVYEQIFRDLDGSITLFDNTLPSGRTRPSKPAAHALLSRIYLNQGNYSKAETEADACLSLYSKLIDYNTLSKTATAPFSNNHDEQLYARYAINNPSYSTRGRAAGANTYIQISQDLIQLYQANDLRKTILFVLQTDGTYDVKQGYYGVGLNPFTGLAVDEIYLIKAECLARRGDIIGAMEKLDQLRIKRWNPSATSPSTPYQKLIALDKTDALRLVILERRKELVWRGIRWEDLKRLNRDGANISLTRRINGTTYTLSPYSSNYVFPIPDEEVKLSGIQQNTRE